MSDDQMSASELAAHFGEAVPEEKPRGENDIYNIAARVKNLARIHGNLTPMGEMLCNSYVHVIKSFYDFSATIQDEKVKEKLNSLIKSKESMPGDLIAAIGANVRPKAPQPPAQVEPVEEENEDINDLMKKIVLLHIQNENKRKEWKSNTNSTSDGETPVESGKSLPPNTCPKKSGMSKIRGAITAILRTMGLKS